MARLRYRWERVWRRPWVKWLFVAAGLVVCNTLWLVVSRYFTEERFPVVFTVGAVVSTLTVGIGSLSPRIVDGIKKEQARRRARTQGHRRHPVSEADLLAARNQVVRFTGRRAHLNRLVHWCIIVRDDRVRLILGPGGIGKTRLAHELERVLQEHEEEWFVEFAAADHAITVLEEAVGEGHTRILLIVDYAETATHLDDLVEAVADVDWALRVRLLLIARDIGEWWRLLFNAKYQVRELLQNANDEESLPPVVDVTIAPQKIVDDAVQAFAKHLDVEPVPQVRVHARRDTTMLELHSAALIGVLDARDNMPTHHRQVISTVDLDQVFNHLLTHEMRYWIGTARRDHLITGPLGADPSVLDQIVAAAALLGATSNDELRDILRRVSPGVDTIAFAKWLQSLYPAPRGSTEKIGTLVPDRLAELHIVTTFTKFPELAQACLTQLGAERTSRVVARLAHAATDLHRPELAANALALLERALDNLPDDQEELLTASRRLPEHSVRLTAVGIRLAQRIIALDPQPQPLQAIVRLHLGIRLYDDGRHDEAIETLQDAVTLFEQLPASRQEKVALDMARAHRNLGIALAQSGRANEALGATERALQVIELATEPEGRALAALRARTLADLGARYMEVGRIHQAFDLTARAVTLQEKLLRDPAIHYRDALARSLTNLSSLHAELGQQAEALTAAARAVSLRNELGAADPDRYTSARARALVNYSSRLADIGTPNLGLQPANEAVDLYRRLDAENQRAYRPHLARALTHLAARHAELEELDTAIELVSEAITMQRELTSTRPLQNERHLARSLSRLGLWRLLTGDVLGALDALQEASQIQQSRFDETPERHRPHALLTQMRLGAAHRAHGDLDAAKRAYVKARDHAALLAEEFPAKYEEQLSKIVAALGDPPLGGNSGS
jgi:tetratricopeptide (TPR) repeat protein